MGSGFIPFPRVFMQKRIQQTQMNETQLSDFPLCNSTWYFQVVPPLGTEQVWRCLTLVIIQKLVFQCDVAISLLILNTKDNYYNPIKKLVSDKTKKKKWFVFSRLWSVSYQELFRLINSFCVSLLLILGQSCLHPSSYI